MPSKPKLGQNFLNDPQAIDRIVAALGNLSSRTVVEIGPGAGAITAPLAARAHHVVAIEYDHDLALHLRVQFPASKLTVVEQDVLNFDFAAAALSAGQKLVVVGNLPYYITSPILQQSLRQSVPRAVFLIQKEVAERLAAKPGTREYGFLTVQTALFASVRRLFDVKPSAFHPPPKVDSSVILVEPHGRDWGVDREALVRFAGLCFEHKRKTLRNNLAETYGKERIDSWPEAGMRAEQLAIEGFVEMYARIAGSGGERA